MLWGHITVSAKWKTCGDMILGFLRPQLGLVLLIGESTFWLIMLLFFFWFRLLNDVQSQVFVLVSVSIQFVPWTMGTCTCLCGGSLFVVRATPDGAGGHEAYSPWN